MEYRQKVKVPEQVRKNIEKRLGSGRHRIFLLKEEEYMDVYTTNSAGAIARNDIGYIVTKDKIVEAVGIHGNRQVLRCRVDTIFVDGGPAYFERRTPIRKILLMAVRITHATATVGCVDHPDFGHNYFASTPDSDWHARGFAISHLNEYHRTPRA